MSIESFFHKLGAPLKNPRWSWGAIGRDGDVYLRVWQHETQRLLGKLYSCIYLHGIHDDSNLGNNERWKQIQMIESGSKCFLIMCLAKDTKAPRLEIGSFNRREIFLGGNLLRSNGDVWIEILGRRQVN